MWRVLIILLSGSILYLSCKPQTGKMQFVLHEGKDLGIDFSNDLEIDVSLNIFNYMYYYNGGGIGAGDFNNDGLIDLFFTANRKPNRLYLNVGDLKFKDITDQAGIRHNEYGWSTGVSVVDINDDGMLDLYISEVGEFENLKSQNYLYVCQEINENGIPLYEEKGREYGLDQIGFSTQAAFFDYDLDGDLDLFQLNHSVHENGTFGQRKSFLGTKHDLSGDRFFVNDNGNFIEKSLEVGIESSVIGYGLGVATGDINMDGYPDIYVGNDFHENDYLYLNNGDGTFTETGASAMQHTSRFSMGVDIGDINNDLFPDIVSLDMLPYDPYILKKSEGEDALGIFRFKLSYGYSYQYAKNSLQLNNANGTFSDIAMYSDVYATDWSWAPILADFNNDGIKDLFVSNGIPKRMNDIDYINFISNDDVQWRIKSDNADDRDMSYLEKLPEIKLPNKVFYGSEDLRFKDQEIFIKNNKASYSNGAIAADLDNDGDLDVITSNIDQNAFVYENISSDSTQSNRIRISLRGADGNRNAVGSKVIVELKDGKRMLCEKFPVRGFQSSYEGDLHIGIGSIEDVQSITLIWPDNTYQVADVNTGTLDFTYTEGLPAFDYQGLSEKSNEEVPFLEISEELELDFVHDENDFVEFNREPLIPHSTSTEGPALAVGDLNGDGLQDIFLGGAKRKRSALYFQTPEGRFRSVEQWELMQDSIYEDVDAHIADFNGDGWNDLVVGSGGNEYFGKSEFLNSRLYINDGSGQLVRKEGVFDSIYSTTQRLVPADFDQDGDLDLFMASRAVSWSYGSIPESYLLQNDGAGNFTDVSDEMAEGLKNIGMITDARWTDLDLDGDDDLIVGVEWDNIYAFINESGRSFSKHRLTPKKGLWGLLLPVDFDHDGDMDLLAGNLGLNSRLKASGKEPIRMYVNDYDQNGRSEQILTYYLDGKETIFPNKMELERQLPYIKKKYLMAADFAAASLADVVGEDQLSGARVFECDYLSNSVLINEGDFNFRTVPLPNQAQMSPFKAGVVKDVDNDSRPDIMLAGNYFDANVQMGRYDADYGTLFYHQEAGKYRIADFPGLPVTGQVRYIKPVEVAGRQVWLFARNDDKLLAIDLNND